MPEEALTSLTVSDSYAHLYIVCGGRLQTRDLTSRDWTTRHHTARVDIARLVSVFE